MKIELSELLNIYKADEIDKFLKNKTGYNLNERNLTDEKIIDFYRFVGDNPSNGSIINMLKYPEKGIIERITNAIDAVLEKQKEINSIGAAKSADVIVKKAFPKFYNNKQDVLKGEATNAYEAKDMVVLSINDGSRSNKPTIDILDQGKGINGDQFINTILSINKGNKLSSNKNYLIGAFGQGGSTSLPHSYATIIVSKYESKYYTTIIKPVELAQYKNFAFVYLCEKGNIIECELGELSKIKDQQVINFINNESGTLIRMIETDIAREYRLNDISKPGMLGDYVNTELFNVALPVKMVENRSDYTINKHAQNRNAFGTYSKLHSWKYSKKDMNGSIKIVHNNNTYNVDYYVLLPEDENKWGSDAECKKVYRQFNVHEDPIIYTVNGQFVSSERFTKLKNIGLSFLQYRLLVVINLDVLGIEKYKFFTSDRAGIKNSDLTRGFLDVVVNSLKNEETIVRLNEIIANKSINSHVDNDLIKDISGEVKSIYNKYLSGGNLLTGGHSGNPNKPLDEEIFEDVIEDIQITTSKNIFYKNENVKVVLTTKARKTVNENSMIIAYLDGKACYSNMPTYMNGRIQYVFTEKTIGVGEHTLMFECFKSDAESIESNTLIFKVIDDILVEKEIKGNKKLNIDIHLVDEKELIVQISKDVQNKKIDAYLCLNHDLMNEVYGKSSSTDSIQSMKNNLIKPMLLFVLFLDKMYDDLESDEKRNELVLSFAKTTALAYK